MFQSTSCRLFSILQKHIKRQIISLNGGFKLIADLNAYHAFISGLKVCPEWPSTLENSRPHNDKQVQSIATDFSHLKMLGHVFVVDDAKDLAQIVRDATRYGGSYRPEVIHTLVLEFSGIDSIF